MSKPRIVPVLVTNPEVTHVSVEFQNENEDSIDGGLVNVGTIPVPEDDTLHEDLRFAADVLDVHADNDGWTDEEAARLRSAAANIRARFYLDDDQ